MIKSQPVSGVVYNLCKSALSRSFAMSVAENKVIKDSPNTVIPGVKLFISNKCTGIFACMVLRSTSNTNGKPNPNPRLIGSRKISFVHRFAKVNILILRPPFYRSLLQWKQMRFQNHLFLLFYSILLLSLLQEAFHFS